MDAWNSMYKTHLGNLGLGRAIAYYTSKCATVLLPLNDSQKYDLAVDVDNKLMRVSIKTTLSKSKSGKFLVQMKNTTLGSDHNTIRRFDNTSCDIVFIVTKEGDMYEIPASEISVKDVLTLSSLWDKYKVSL